MGSLTGVLVAPEEKSKHNLSCAIGPTIRLLQEVHRRAGEPCPRCGRTVRKIVASGRAGNRIAQPWIAGRFGKKRLGQ